ncbi:MAG TPA: alpha/beta hydrolase [Anaerolineales bacterium]|nr:alpha/beta hydrolase [Anaerolineales bacterium]
MIFVLVLAATAVGIFYHTPGASIEFTTVRGERAVFQGSGLYRYDPAPLADEGVVWDAINLLIGLPLFAVAIYLSQGNSMRGRLLLGGLLFYWFYAYLQLMVTYSFNFLFLDYVTIYALSAVSFFMNLHDIEVARLPAQVSERFPRRLFIGFTFVVSIMLVFLWLGRILPVMASGRFPPELAGLNTLITRGVRFGHGRPLNAGDRDFALAPLPVGLPAGEPQYQLWFAHEHHPAGVDCRALDPGRKDQPHRSRSLSRDLPGRASFCGPVFQERAGGKSAPTVILIHGGGDNSLIWSLVYPGVARAYRVCSYDRPGYGWSETVPTPRSAAQNANELHLLLSQAGIEPPYLLVAHSIGGLTAHQFTHRYSDEVAGLILLDSMLAEQMVAQGTFWMRLPLVDTAICRLFSSSGLYRFLFDTGRLAPDEPVLKLPVELQPDALALRLRVGLCQATYAEQAAAIQDVHTLHEKGGLGDVPVAVLNAYETEADRKSLVERQKYVQRLSTQITYTAVGPSGHHIHLDQPDEVVQAILLMGESIR